MDPNAELAALSSLSRGHALPKGCEWPWLSAGLAVLWPTTEASSEVGVRVLLGGPEWTVGGTIFEMWLGSL